MSTYRPREKRGRLKLSKNIARKYRESKCRDCSVVVAPMDFAKILGKFTKVKIQYESSTSPKTKQGTPNVNSRLKSNENGMVLIHRTAYNPHPVKDLYSSKKQKQTKAVDNTSPRQPSNILKENNRLKKTPVVKDRNSNYDKKTEQKIHYSKQYGIIFTNPISADIEIKNKASLSELLPLIDKTILPSEEWNIDYFPKDEEPKEDQVYDRIAAELEDLMYDDKAILKDQNLLKQHSVKSEEFPSILDILNDNSSESNSEKLSEQNPKSEELKGKLESSDVEAMLLGENNANNVDSVPMEVDKNNVMEDDEQLNDKKKNIHKITEPEDRCSSPSILDEALQKGIEEHLPDKSNVEGSDENVSGVEEKLEISKLIKNEISNSQDSETKSNDKSSASKLTKVSHVVFKQVKDGSCCRSVMCPNSLKYNIELEGKSVELLGAPKFISSLDDLQVLLQIVNESRLSSFYVLH